MSKKVTPCEMLGYKVGDEFEVIRHHAFKKGQVVTLHEDDGTECPLFAGDGGGAGVFDGVECSFATLNKQVREIANKLKPAKQALADAIHQNGGWCVERFMYATSNYVGMVKMFVNKPKLENANWNADGTQIGFAWLSRPLPNWHQCVLSRDEYFTAYPEQVKVDVSNETEHKVDAEMKSESEMTIKAGDWHKNGELPPVGEVCLWIGRKENGDYRADLRTGDRVEVIAHYKPRSDGPMVAVFAYESRESIGRQTDQSIAKCFSPLRTEREKAIDEMVDCLSSRWANCEEIAEHLYESGYRKEVK